MARRSRRNTGQATTLSGDDGATRRRPWPFGDDLNLNRRSYSMSKNASWLVGGATVLAIIMVLFVVVGGHNKATTAANNANRTTTTAPATTGSVVPGPTSGKGTASTPAVPAPTSGDGTAGAPRQNVPPAPTRSSF